MKKILKYVFISAFAIASVNCTTSYDAYGNPKRTVSPEGAVAGAAAVGILGYAIANNNKKKKNRRNYNRYDERYHDHNHRRQQRGYYDRYGNYRRD